MGKVRIKALTDAAWAEYQIKEGEVLEMPPEAAQNFVRAKVAVIAGEEDAITPADPDKVPPPPGIDKVIETATSKKAESAEKR